jgi:hypothetical protein
VDEAEEHEIRGNIIFIFQVLRAININIVVSWHVTPYSLVEGYHLNPEGGGSTFLQKVTSQKTAV